MKKGQREVAEAILKLIKPFGGTIRHCPGGRHEKLYFTIQGKEYFTPMPSSPKVDRFAVQHKVNDVKRILRELKLL